jgi:hypothetical protein
LTPLGPAAGGLVPVDDGFGGLAPLGSDPWGDLTTLPALSDGAFGGVPLPAPAAASTRRRPARRSGPLEAGSAVIVVPAVAMLVVGSFSLLGVLFYAVRILLVPNAVAELTSRAEYAGSAYVMGMVAGFVVSIAIEGLIIMGSLSMIRSQSYGLALTAAILCILPCTACWMGFPFGVWALIVLCLGSVRRTFD